MSRVTALFRLQVVDLELDACRARLKTVEEMLGENPTVRAAQHELAEADKKLAAARSEARRLELEMQSLAARAADAEKRLYGGQGTHFKELKDQQLETESLKRQHAAAEERHLEALIEVESLEKTLTAARARLDAAQGEAAQKDSRLAQERTELAARLERLEIEREAVCAAIPPEDLETYSRLRRAKNGRALAPVEGGACSICGVAQSSARIQEARQGKALIMCGNCGRILYAESVNAQTATDTDD